MKVALISVHILGMNSRVNLGLMITHIICGPFCSTTRLMPSDPGDLYCLNELSGGPLFTSFIIVIRNLRIQLGSQSAP